MSIEERKIDKEKLKPIYERRKERELIIKELKDRGPLTIPELSEATGLETTKVFQHVIALTQFGRIVVASGKGDYLTYALSK